ncbi:MAG TPA: hypothetical protein VIL57_10315 [Bacteroidia bacterium]
MKKLCVLSASLFLLSASLLAQTNVTWQETNIHFTMPESGVPGEHSENKFEWNGTTLKVTLYHSKRGFDLKTADQATIRAGKEVGVAKVEREKDIETPTMKGVYFIGDRAGQKVLFAGLLNPKLKRGLFIDIEFEGDKAQVLPILQTFVIEK